MMEYLVCWILEYLCSFIKKYMSVYTFQKAVFSTYNYFTTLRVYE